MGDASGVRTVTADDGIELHYEIVAQNATSAGRRALPVVLLHGALAGRRTFSRQHQSLASLGRLIIPSARGHDGSDPTLSGDYGIDTISTGATIACAMELFEKGALPEQELGFPLRFGDAAALVRAVEMTGKREGFGDVLADGSYRLAVRYGHPEFFMGAKKLEMSAYSPRVFQGMALHMRPRTAARATCAATPWLRKFSAFRKRPIPW